MAQALTQFSEGRPLGCRGTSSWIALFAFTFRETYIPAGPVLAGQTTSGLASQAGWPPVVCSPPNHQIGRDCRSAPPVGAAPAPVAACGSSWFKSLSRSLPLKLSI